METLNIEHLNPGTRDHVQAVVENKHYGKEVEIVELTEEVVTYRVVV